MRTKFNLLKEGYFASIPLSIILVIYFLSSRSSFNGSIKHTLIPALLGLVCILFIIVYTIRNKRDKHKEENETQSEKDFGIEKEAINVITELQDCIKKESNYSFKFSFEIVSDKVRLGVPRGFVFELRDKDKNPVKKIFEEDSLSLVIENFVNFFKEGNEGKIATDENNFQFCAQFHYEKVWVVTHTHTGHYSYQDSFDD